MISNIFIYILAVGHTGYCVVGWGKELYGYFLYMTACLLVT